MRVTDEYKAYLKALEGAANLNFKLESAQIFTGLERLIADGFIVISEGYRRWVKQHGREL